MTMTRGTWGIARLAWKRMWRGKMIWVTALLMVLPLVLAVAALIAAHGQDPAESWPDVAEVTFRSLVLLAPVLHLAPFVGEELDGKTYTYLWSRPVSRQAIVLGKLLAFTPLATVAAMAVVAGAHTILAPGDGQLGRMLLATAAGVVSASAFAVGMGSLVPRHPLALALGYVVLAEQVLPEVPAVNNVSTLYHVGAIAGLHGDGALAPPLLALGVLTVVWLAVAFWRVGSLELRKEWCVVNPDEVIAHYERRLAEHGTGARAADWSPQSQLANFVRLARVEGLASGARVLDVGCGLGALKQFLDDGGIAVDYTGWDVSPKMIEAARRAHPEARFEVRDLLALPASTERFDFVFCSGTLNLLVTDHERWVMAMIQTMWSLTGRALAFNMLSAHSLVLEPTTQLDGLRYYAWPHEVLAFCQRLSPWATLDHAGRRATFQIFLYRGNPGTADEFLARAAGTLDWESTVIYLEEIGAWDRVLEHLATIGETGETLCHAGSAHAALGDGAAATRAYERAARIDPGCWRAVLRLAGIARREGRATEAEALYRRALAVKPTIDGAREGLARMLAARGEHDEAAAIAALMTPGAARDLQFAELSIARGDDLAARAAYESALAVAPYNLAAMVGLARLAEKAGALGDALGWWRRVADLAPGVDWVKSENNRLFNLTKVKG